MSSVGPTDATHLSYASWGHPNRNQQVGGDDNGDSNPPSHLPPVSHPPPSQGWYSADRAGELSLPPTDNQESLWFVPRARITSTPPISRPIPYDRHNNVELPLTWPRQGTSYLPPGFVHGESRGESRGRYRQHQQPSLSIPPPPSHGWDHLPGAYGKELPQTPPEESRKKHKKQRYTYIPSTSSFSPRVDDQQPPSSIPLLPGHVPFIPPIIRDNYSNTELPTSWPDTPYLPPGISPKDGGTVPVVYASVDPFRPQATPVIPLPSVVDDDEARPPQGSSDYDYVVYPYMRRRTALLALIINFLNQGFNFLSSTLPRNVYLLFLLWLPSFYFSRVARIFDEADMTMPEIETMALQGMAPAELQFTSPASANLKATWEAFIDSLLREWKTFNIVSVLLLSAILTLLQIEGAGSDPITRNCALISLICALMSLLYGCMYTIRFANMRKTYKALEWAKMAQKSKTLIWWNVWVLLALPATWLTWSIILYVACIMTFVWRTGIEGLEPTNVILSRHAELAIRIAISVILALGLLYFLLILNTLRRYGDSMDKEFKQELDLIVKAKRRHAHSYFNPYYYSSHVPPGEYPARRRWFKPIKIMDFRFQSRLSNAMPDFLADRKFTLRKWEKFISEAFNAWNGVSSGPFNVVDPTTGPPRPQDSVAQLLEKWNRKYFQPHSTLGILCHEYIDLFPESPVFAIYLIDVTPVDGQPIITAERFGPLPEGLHRIDIFDQPGNSQRSARRILGRTSIYSTRSPLEGRVRYDHQSSKTTDTTGSHPQSGTTTPNTPISPRSSRSRSPADWRPSLSSYIDESGRFRTPVAERRHHRSRSRRNWKEPPLSPITASSEGEPSREPLSTPAQPTIPDISSPTSPNEHDSHTPEAPVVPPVIPSNPETVFQHNMYGSSSWYPTMAEGDWRGPPPVPPVIPTGPYDVHAQRGYPTGFGRRRSRTLSPPPHDSRLGGRNIALPAVSPDYSWFAQPESRMATPSTYRTVTPSAISNLDHIIPPFMHNQQAGWTPYQYPQQFMTPRAPYPQQFMTPRTPRHPDPPPNLNPPALSTPYTPWFGPPPPTAQSQHLPRQPMRKSSLPTETPEVPVARPLSPRQSRQSPDLQVGDSDRNTRRRSTSTSYRSFSSSPSQDHLSFVPENPNPPHRTSPAPDLPVQTASGTSAHDDGSQIGRSDVEPLTPMDRENQGSGLLFLTDNEHSEPVQAPVHSGMTSTLSDVAVDGPWTMDQLSLRTIFNYQ